MKNTLNFPLRLWERVFLKSESECLKLINLKTVFRSFQQIEKLKAIIFSSDQLNLFNLLPDPILNPQEKGNSENNDDMYKIIGNSSVRDISRDERNERIKKAVDYFEKEKNKKIQMKLNFSSKNERLFQYLKYIK